MRHVREFQTRAELLAFLEAEWLGWTPSSVVTVEEYGGYDERIGWHTHLLCIDGRAALFTDGPMPPDDS